MRVTTAHLDEAADVAVRAGGSIAGAQVPPSPSAGLQRTGAALAVLYSAIAAADDVFSGALAGTGSSTATGSTAYTRTDARAASTVASTVTSL